MPSTTCPHMLERVIMHEPSQLHLGLGFEVVGGIVQEKTLYTYAPGDRVVLACPHGCADIIISVVPNFPAGDVEPHAEGIRITNKEMVR